MFFNSSPSDHPLPRRVWLAWAFAVFFIPFQLHYNYILNAFYHFGTNLNDAGLLSHLLWHNDWRLIAPPSFAHYSYFTIHLPLSFLIPTYLSHFIPTHMVEFYGSVVAAQYASLGLALFYAFSTVITPRRQWQMLLLALIAIGFSFNGSVMDGITYIHLEYMMPLSIFLFLLHYVSGRSRSALFFFVFALVQREDAGLHITAILGLIAIIRFIKYRSLESVKREACFIVAALVYSFLACAAVYVLDDWYGHHSRSFTGVYTGDPLYAHLSWSLLWDRAGVIFRDRLYIWAGLLLTLIWSIRTRNPYLIVGYAAYIPWMIFSYLANFIVPGELGGYYCFPLVLSLAWPVLAELWRYGNPLPAGVAYKTILFQAVLIGVSLITWNNERKFIDFEPDYAARWGSWRVQQGAENRAQVQEFVALVDSSVGDLGVLMADNGTISLIWGAYYGREVLQLGSTQPADTVLYMGNPDWPRAEVIAQVRKNHLTNHYCMVAAPICLFTNRAQPQLGALWSLMRERGSPPEVMKQLQQP